MNRFDKRAGRERKSAPKKFSPYPDAPRLVVGTQPVREAIRAHGRKLAAVQVERSPGGADGRLDAIARFATDQHVPVVLRSSRAELDRIAGGVQHQGAIAWAPELALLDPVEVLSLPDPFIVALDGILDPQNFGAVVRSAVGLGATAVVWPESASAPLTPATFRASAGAIEHARLCRVPSLVRFLDDATAAGLRVVGLSPDAPLGLVDLDLKPPAVIVIGSEHDGLGRAVRRRCAALGRLTLRGPVESLNASVACALALQIGLIQRMKPSG